MSAPFGTAMRIGALPALHPIRRGAVRMTRSKEQALALCLQNGGTLKRAGRWWYGRPQHPPATQVTVAWLRRDGLLAGSDTTMAFTPDGEAAARALVRMPEQA